MHQPLSHLLHEPWYRATPAPAEVHPLVRAARARQQRMTPRLVRQARFAPWLPTIRRLTAEDLAAFLFRASPTELPPASLSPADWREALLSQTTAFTAPLVTRVLANDPAEARLLAENLALAAPAVEALAQWARTRVVAAAGHWDALAWDVLRGLADSAYRLSDEVAEWLFALVAAPPRHVNGLALRDCAIEILTADGVASDAIVRQMADHVDPVHEPAAFAALVIHPATSLAAVRRYAELHSFSLYGVLALAGQADALADPVIRANLMAVDDTFARLVLLAAATPEELGGLVHALLATHPAALHEAYRRDVHNLRARLTRTVLGPSLRSGDPAVRKEAIRRLHRLPSASPRRAPLAIGCALAAALRVYLASHRRELRNAHHRAALLHAAPSAGIEPADRAA